jgi:hypothetical protein
MKKHLDTPWRLGRIPLALAVLTALFFAGSLSGARLGATDFIRGDANGDGTVSLSDVHKIVSWLFRGQAAPGCLDSADTDDDGALNLTDATKLLNFLALASPPPAPPFPNAGSDTTPSGLTCESAAAAAPAADPGSKLEVLDARAPGGENGVAYVTLALSSSRLLAGYEGTLRLPPGLAAGVRKGNKDLTQTYDKGFIGARLDGDRIHFAFLSSLTKGSRIAVGQGVSIVEIAICLNPGTPAGDYPLILESGELVAFNSAQAIRPDLVDGTLAVASQVTGGTRCEDLPPAPLPPTPPPPPPLPPPPDGPVNVAYSLADAFAFHGEEASVAFTIHSNVAVQGYEFSVDFDEQILELNQVEIAWEKPPFSSPEYDYASFHIDDANETAGNGGVDEGYVAGGVVFSLVEPVALPVNEDVEALRFHFRVRDEAPPGATKIRFADGGLSRPSAGHQVRNAITGLGMVIPPELAESFIFVDSVLRVQPDVVFFIRGDSNADGRVDISDPVSMLGYLFRGGVPLRCYEAADANDDGKVDVSDPVYTLNYLFLGDDPPPAPFPESGKDLTDDGISCRSPQ